MKLCKCNNCNSLFIDHNPQVDAIEFMDDPGIDELVQLTDDGDTFWGCPNCLTDDYLTDITEIQQ